MEDADAIEQVVQYVVHVVLIVRLVFLLGHRQLDDAGGFDQLSHPVTQQKQLLVILLLLSLVLGVM